MTPPATPGTASRSMSLWSTLPSMPCAAPETPVVNTSAVCTLALTAAGGMPIASRIEDETRPKAIPSAPSTSCAPRPMATKIRKWLSIRSMRCVQAPPAASGAAD